VDFAISEVPFTAADYQAYPDLQMYPAFAGAVVPIYNIPELGSDPPLVLSRMTLANIFLGKISFWNDSSIIADNANKNITDILLSLHKPIEVVVRHDSSGISKIFAQSLDSFDPKTGV
jgi:phosphate transport system substrate-binding protein